MTLNLPESFRILLMNIQAVSCWTQAAKCVIDDYYHMSLLLARYFLWAISLHFIDTVVNTEYVTPTPPLNSKVPCYSYNHDQGYGQGYCC